MNEIVKIRVDREPADNKVTIFRPFCSFEGFISSVINTIQIIIDTIDIIFKDIYNTYLFKIQIPRGK